MGIPAIEDKIVQRAAAGVLGAIWEPEFMGFSYGFRPGRSPHQALDALAVGLTRRNVNWVLDADIRGFYDTIDHEWLVKFVEHRIRDQRIIRLLKKWLRAGVLEDGSWRPSEEGTPQGGLISPVLANIYLHYAFDQWAEQWRRRKARGHVIIVRYADDFVVGFEHRTDAERFRGELAERLGKFKLELQAEKTRLLEFGRFAAVNRAARGEGKPDTFNFLGFTHICGKTQAGKYVVWRVTMRKRVQAKLKAIKVGLKRKLHEAIPRQGSWLQSILRGHYRYYGVPGNWAAMKNFRHWVTCLWRAMLRRRSQRGYVTWERMGRLADRWLPEPCICHPYPWQRLIVKT